MAKHRDSWNSQKEKTTYPKERKQYFKPELVIYGHLKRLTEGAGISPGDAGSHTKG